MSNYSAYRQRHDRANEGNFNMKYLITLICWTGVGAYKKYTGDSGIVYNCTYCEPQQIHIAFGGK